MFSKFVLIAIMMAVDSTNGIRTRSRFGQLVNGPPSGGSYGNSNEVRPNGGGFQSTHNGVESTVWTASDGSVHTSQTNLSNRPTGSSIYVQQSSYKPTGPSYIESIASGPNGASFYNRPQSSYTPSAPSYIENIANGPSGSSYSRPPPSYSPSGPTGSSLGPQQPSYSPTAGTLNQPTGSTYDRPSSPSITSQGSYERPQSSYDRPQSSFNNNNNNQGSNERPQSSVNQGSQNRPQGSYNSNNNQGSYEQPQQSSNNQGSYNNRPQHLPSYDDSNAQNGPYNPFPSSYKPTKPSYTPTQSNNNYNPSSYRPPQSNSNINRPTDPFRPSQSFQPSVSPSQYNPQQQDSYRPTLTSQNNANYNGNGQYGPLTSSYENFQNAGSYNSNNNYGNRPYNSGGRGGKIKFID